MTFSLKRPFRCRSLPCSTCIHRARATSSSPIGCRFTAPAGRIRLWNSTLIEDSGNVDPHDRSAREIPVADLPPETLQFLLSSRYCEVDLLSNTAAQLFGGIAPGWQRVQ